MPVRTSIKSIYGFRINYFSEARQNVVKHGAKLTQDFNVGKARRIDELVVNSTESSNLELRGQSLKDLRSASQGRCNKM